MWIALEDLRVSKFDAQLDICSVLMAALSSLVHDHQERMSAIDASLRDLKAKLQLRLLTPAMRVHLLLKRQTRSALFIEV